MRLYPNLTLLIFAFFFSSLAVKAQTAGFTPSTTSGCPPLVVNCTNTSTGWTSGTWNFGAGGPTVPCTPGDPNASTSYTSPGIYTITLTVTNGSSTSTATTTVTVYPLPVTDFSAVDTSVCPGTPISFINTTSGPGAPFTYTWNFGDGNNSSAASPTHTYGAPGWYNVSLSATNAQGCTKTVTKPMFIHVFNPPIADFIATPTSYCGVPATVTFTNLTSGAAPFTTTWLFGDGGSSSTGTHTYTSTGSYNVTLIVTDANGCSDTITKPGYINISNPVASFTGPTTVCVGSVVNFSNTSATYLTESWDFGDGTGIFPLGSHTYSSPGTYTVTLTIFDGICPATVTHTIVVLPLPPVTITVNPTAPCPPPATVTINATVPPGSTVSWTYGDGGSGGGTTTSHTYGAPGTYSITATVTDANGCVRVVTQTFTLYDLHADISPSVYSGCAPLTVTFTPSVYTIISGVPTPYPYVPASYSWGFGDGGSGGPTSGPTSHTYTLPGTYVCTVTATTANGCVVTETQTIVVGTPPVATFTAAPTHICYSDSVVFTPILITGPVDNYYWMFGDGGSATSLYPYTYTYSLPGVFTVKMVPIYHGCPGDTVIFTNYVTVDSPKAIIQRFYSCTNKRAVFFNNNSMGATSWTWDFGDGSPTSSADTVTHIYPGLGTYTVRLVTHNAASGCRDTTYETIQLFDLSPDFAGLPANICRDDSVHYIAAVAGGVPNDYMWYVGSTHLIPWDGSAFAWHTFGTPGLYTIMLVTRDGHDCLDTMIKTNYTRVAKPNADFTAPTTDACWGVPFTFTDISTDVTGATPFSRYWDFGDGFTITTTSASIAHTYSTGGSFTVTEIVTDAFGCKDTVVKTSYINVHKPVPSFTPSTLNPCQNVPMTFTNTSTGGAISSDWTFGDGNSSTVTSPTHTYSVIGVYDVRLIVTDAFGCKDTLTRTAYLNVTRPNAAFSMSDSFSVCPPLSVNFVNGSTGGTSLAWTFGDGNSATAPTPTNMYITPGYYTVQLVVTNAYGCKDTATQHVNVYGYAGAFSYSPLQGCRPLRVFFNASVTNVTGLTWDFQDGSVISSGTNDTISHVYTIPGAYIPKLILSDNTGCQNSSIGIDTIKVDGIITKFTTFPNPVCQNVSFNFIDSSTTYWSPITSRTWYYDGNVSTSTSPAYSYAVAGSYPIKLVVTNGWGCVDSVQANVTVNPPPTITTSPDTVVCVTDPAKLTGYGGVSYTWAPPATLSCTSCNPTNATPTEVTVYTVTGTDAYGCVNTDTVRVGLRTHTISNGWGDTAVCRGVPVPLFDTGGTKYTWAPGWLSNGHISNPIATPPSTQTYTVIAQLASCIPDTNYVTVVIYQPPTVDAGPDQRVLAGTVVNIDAEGTLIADQKWVPNSQLFGDTSLHTSAEMERSTTFYIDVVSDRGCRASDSVRVLVYCDNSQIFIPNSFTPNGDGENDVFYPRGKGVKAINSFRIYNRWGQLIYDRPHIQLNDPTFGWNGTFNGDRAHPDVYVYFIEALCYTGEPIFIKGDVTILK